MLKLHDFCNRALAADPMPPNISDTFIIIKPRDEWPDSGLSKSDLVAKVEKTLESLPGGAFEITQPIQMRWVISNAPRSEEHTSELQSLMRISYAVFCLKKKKYTSVNVQHQTERIIISHSHTTVDYYYALDDE